MQEAFGKALSWMAFLFAGATALLSLLVLFYHIDNFPEVGYDEWIFLYPYERAISYHDTSEKMIFDEFANYGQHTKNPPLIPSIRLLFHRLCQTGAKLSRWISAAEFVLIGFLLAITSKKLGGSATIALAGMGFFWSQPTVFLFARIVRFEQDIFFLGCLSITCCLLMTHQGAWSKIALMISGLSAGMASCMHPLGCMFALAIVFYAASAVRKNGLAGKWHLTIICWIVPFLLPVAYTAHHIVSDWNNQRIYTQSVFEFYREIDRTRYDSFAELYGFSFPFDKLPTRVKAFVNEHRLVLVSFASEGIVTTIRSYILGFMSVVIPLVGIVLLSRKTRAADPSAPIRRKILYGWLLLLLSSIVVGLCYRPNSDYAIYFLGTSYIVSVLVLAYGYSLLRHRLARVLVYGILLFVILANTIVHCMILHDHRHILNLSSDKKIETLTRIAECVKTRPDDPGGEKVYADNISWGGAGRRHTPVFEYVIAQVGQPLPNDGVVINNRWYMDFTLGCPNFLGASVDLDERCERMRRLLEGNHVAAFLFAENAPWSSRDVTLFFGKNNFSEPDIVRLLADGTSLWYKGRPFANESFSVPPGPYVVKRPLSIPLGTYAIMVTGRRVKKSSMVLHCDHVVVAKSQDARYFPHEYFGSILYFDHPGDDSLLLEIATESDESASIDIRIMRLSEASSR